ATMPLHAGVPGNARCAAATASTPTATATSSATSSRASDFTSPPAVVRLRGRSSVGCLEMSMAAAPRARARGPRARPLARDSAPQDAGRRSTLVRCERRAAPAGSAAEDLVDGPAQRRRDVRRLVLEPAGEGVAYGPPP